MTISADTEASRAAARSVFDLWIGDLTELFSAAGIDDADDVAWMLFASVEGALIFARGERSMRALDLVERQMVAYVRTLT